MRPPLSRSIGEPGGMSKGHRRSLSEPKSAAALLEASRAELGIKALGVVCEVRLHRGGRQLTVKSAVEVLNETDFPLLIMMKGLERTERELRVEPGETASLPLRFTAAGSAHACRNIQIRPAEPIGPSKAVSGPPAYHYGSLVPLAPGSSLLTCGTSSLRADEAGRAPQPAWMGCARIDRLSTTSELMPSASARRARGQLTRFRLDPSELLLHTHACLLPVGAAAGAAAGVPVPATLYLTTGCMCIGASLSSENVVHKWVEIEQIHAGAKLSLTLPNVIEVDMSHGKRCVFGGVMSREHVIGQMIELRARARAERLKGIEQWQPRRLVIQAPLTLTSLLPCAVHVAMRQLREDEMPDDDELGPGSGRVSTMAEASASSLREETPAAGMLDKVSEGDSSRSPTRQPPSPLSEHFLEHPAASKSLFSSWTPRYKRHHLQTHTEELFVQPGTVHRFHSLHATTNLSLRIWLDGHAWDSARMHGEIKFRRPMGATEHKLRCIIYPKDENAQSPRAVWVHLALATTAEGTCLLSLSSPHWLVNLSSLPLRVYHARESNPSHVLEALPNARCPQIFSFSDQNLAAKDAISGAMLAGAGIAGTGCPGRLGIAPTLSTALTTGDGSAAVPTAGREPGMVQHPRARREHLSAAFSVDAVGNDGPLELRTNEGEIAELAVHIGSSEGPLASAGSTIVTVRDRFLFRNDTGVDFDFCELPPAGAPLASTDRPPPKVEHGSEAEARIGRLPADGGSVPLKWRERTGEGRKSELARKLSIRPTNGFHDWCAPFSAEAVGKVVLKLRPRAVIHTDGDREAALEHLRERYEGDGAADRPTGEAISAELEGPSATSLVGASSGTPHPPKGGKLQPACTSGPTVATADDTHSLWYEGETLYLVLTVTMNGSQRLLRLKPLTQRQLPFKVVNRSDSLIAFRQQNCDHWDLLGAAESCDYMWDDPLGTRALQIYGCDATGLHFGLSGAGTYTFARKAGKATACPDLKLDNNNSKPDKSSKASAGSESSRAESSAAAAPQSAQSAQSARPAGAAHARLQALESPLLLSAACSLVTAYAPRPRTRRGAPGADSYESSAAARRALTRESGWLCLTSTHVLFVPFEKPGEGGKGSVLGMRLSRTRRNTSHGTAGATGAAGAATAATAGIGESLHNIHQLRHAPLHLVEIAHVRAGALPGELLIFTRHGSHVVARSLYQAEALCERIASQHRKVRGDRYPRSSRLSTSSEPRAQAKDASAEGGRAPNLQTGRSRSSSVTPSREGASRTVQAMVRSARARRELRRRRVERLYESGHSAIAKVLVRAKQAPLLLGMLVLTTTPSLPTGARSRQACSLTARQQQCAVPAPLPVI